MPRFSWGWRQGPVVILYLILVMWMTWWHRHYGFIDFGGMDGGVLIQAAWAVSHHSIPYTDIPTALPPLFLLSAGAAFDLGGASWSSLNWLLCLFAFVSFTWSFLLLAKVNRGPWLALFFALACHGVTLLPVSWWWYNQMTTLIALLALTSGYALARFPADRWCAASLGCSAALLFLCKINTAALTSLSLVVVLLPRRDTRKPACVALAAAVAADALLFLACRMSPLAYLHFVEEFSVRVSSPGWLRYCLIGALPPEHILGLENAGLLALVAVLLVAFQTDPCVRRDLALWLAICLAVSSLQMATNNGFKMGDTPYGLLIAVLALPGVKRIAPLVLGSTATVCSVFFLFQLGLLIGATRQAVVAMGTSTYADGSRATVQLQEPPFFRGLRTEDHLARVLRETAAALAHPAGSPPSRVFFGPRLDFSYAAFGLPFPKGLPIWWEKVPSTHRPDAYPMGYDLPPYLGPSHWLADGGPVDTRVQRFIDCGFTLCLFVRTKNRRADMIFLPEDLRAYLRHHFHEVDYPDIAAFVADEPATTAQSIDTAAPSPLTTDVPTTHGADRSYPPRP